MSGSARRDRVQMAKTKIKRCGGRGESVGGIGGAVRAASAMWCRRHRRRGESVGGIGGLVRAASAAR